MFGQANKVAGDRVLGGVDARRSETGLLVKPKRGKYVPAPGMIA